MLMLSAKTPLEKIISREPLITMANAEKMIRERKFVVQLDCGHLVHTRAANRAICPRCTEMLRRSLIDGSEDYDGFRKGFVRDTMVWPDDPCRQFNEPKWE